MKNNPDKKYKVKVVPPKPGKEHLVRKPDQLLPGIEEFLQNHSHFEDMMGYAVSTISSMSLSQEATEEIEAEFTASRRNCIILMCLCVERYYCGLYFSSDEQVDLRDKIIRYALSHTET